MHARLAFLLLFAATLPPALAAQWFVAPEIGTIDFSGSARDTVAGLDLGPTRTTAIGVRLTREIGRFAVALRFRTGTSGLGAWSRDLTVIQEHALRLYDVAALASWQITARGATTGLRLEAGPSGSLWKAKSGEDRMRVGAIVALSGLASITPRYSALLRFEGGASGSTFDPADVPAGVARRTAWRRGVSLELRRSL